MLMEVEQVDHHLVIYLKEVRLMAHLEAEFRALIAKQIEQGANNIILDLSEVRYLDSSGLGALVSIRKMLGANGTFLLCGVTGQVADVFRVTRMNAVFDIFDDAELALAA